MKLTTTFFAIFSLLVSSHVSFCSNNGRSPSDLQRRGAEFNITPPDNTQIHVDDDLAIPPEEDDNLDTQSFTHWLQQQVDQSDFDPTSNIASTGNSNTHNDDDDDDTTAQSCTFSTQDDGLTNRSRAEIVAQSVENELCLLERMTPQQRAENMYKFSFTTQKIFSKSHTPEDVNNIMSCYVAKVQLQYLNRLKPLIALTQVPFCSAQVQTQFLKKMSKYPMKIISTKAKNQLSVQQNQNIAIQAEETLEIARYKARFKAQEEAHKAERAIRDMMLILIDNNNNNNNNDTNQDDDDDSSELSIPNKPVAKSESDTQNEQ